MHWHTQRERSRCKFSDFAMHLTRKCQNATFCWIENKSANLRVKWILNTFWHTQFGKFWTNLRKKHEGKHEHSNTFLARKRVHDLEQIQAYFHPAVIGVSLYYALRIEEKLLLFNWNMFSVYFVDLIRRIYFRYAFSGAQILSLERHRTLDISHIFMSIFFLPYFKCEFYKHRWFCLT